MSPKRQTPTGTMLKSIQGERYAGKPTPEAEQWLTRELDDILLTCHTFGHKFPDQADILAGKQVRGFSAVPVPRTRTLRIKEECQRDCGVYRTMDTLSGGYWDTDSPYTYLYTDRRYHQPHYGNVTKPYYKAEWGRRFAERIIAGQDTGKAPRARRERRGGQTQATS